MASMATQTQILTTTTLFTSPSTTKHKTNLSPRPNFFKPQAPNLDAPVIQTLARSKVSTNAKANPGSASEQKWTHEGSVTESLPNGMFRVLLDNQETILGYISGKIRKNFVRILPGDRVKVEVSRYDTSRGRIVYRLRNKDPSASTD